MHNQQERPVQPFKPFPLNPKYLVSSSGYVLSFKTGKPLKCTNHKGGYLRLGLVLSDGSDKSLLLHRVIAMTFISNPENKPEVNHIDGNKHNNRVDNLEWVTREENQKHAFLNKLNTNDGVKNSRCLLTEEDVVEIYNRLLLGDKVAIIARDYKVNTSTISNIKRKKNWKELLIGLPDIKLNFKSSAMSEHQIQECKNLRDKGFTCKMMSEILNITLGQAESVFRTKR